MEKVTLNTEARDNHFHIFHLQIVTTWEIDILKKPQLIPPTPSRSSGLFVGISVCENPGRERREFQNKGNFTGQQTNQQHKRQQQQQFEWKQIQKNLLYLLCIYTKWFGCMYTYCQRCQRNAKTLVWVLHLASQNIQP